MNSSTSAPPPALRLLEKRVRGHQLVPVPRPQPVAWWTRWLNRVNPARR